MNELSFEKIDFGLVEADMWPKVIAQIEKDFAENQLDWTVSSEKDLFEGVFESLKSFMLDLSRSNFDLYQLLYRIDVPEKYIISLKRLNDLELFIEKLTELIVRREIQKVLIRKYFSGIN